MLEVTLYIVGVLIMVIGLAVSIGLHEVGHLVPAKLFGVKVTQYMIGFGKTLWSRKKGETEYGIKMIPLGGYIAMTGMYAPKKQRARSGGKVASFYRNIVQEARDASAETVTEGEEDRTFYRLPVWKRIIVMLGGPFMNLVLAFVFFGIVLMGFGVSQYTTTLASVNQCLISATSEQTECTSSDPLAPAAAAGIEPGDRIVAINGAEVSDWTEIRTLVSASPNTPLEVEIERAGSTQTVTLTPAITERYVSDDNGNVIEGEDGTPEIETVGMIGVTPTSEVVQQPITAVPKFVGENVTAVAKMIVGLPQRMVDIWNAAFGADERDPNGPVGVVGVGRLAGEVASLDEAPVAARAQVLVSLLGSLNVALFVFNLVPLLPLDGGHIAGALYEGAKRRIWRLLGRPDPGPVDTAKMVPVTFVVVVLLGAMSLLLLYADIVKPISLFS